MLSPCVTGGKERMRTFTVPDPMLILESYGTNLAPFTGVAVVHSRRAKQAMGLRVSSRFFCTNRERFVKN